MGPNAEALPLRRLSKKTLESARKCILMKTTTSLTMETSAMRIFEILQNKDRQSITELITLHKLFTSKPQVPKFVPRINPKLENEIRSLVTEEDLDVLSDTKSDIIPSK